MEVVSPIYKRWLHEAESDPEGFWAKAAREVSWFRTWDRGLDWQPPTFRWFTGATTNLSYNCLDLQVARGNGGPAGGGAGARGGPPAGGHPPAPAGGGQHGSGRRAPRG